MACSYNWEPMDNTIKLDPKTKRTIDVSRRSFNVNQLYREPEPKKIISIIL